MVRRQPWLCIPMHVFARLALLCVLVFAVSSCQRSKVRTPLGAGVKVEVRMLEPAPKPDIDLPVGWVMDSPARLAYVGPSFIDESDVDGVGIGSDEHGIAVLSINFRADAITRIDKEIAERTGQKAAWIVDGYRIMEVNVGSPHAQQMQVFGLHPCEVEQAYHRMTHAVPPRGWYRGRTPMQTRACIAALPATPGTQQPN